MISLIRNKEEIKMNREEMVELLRNNDCSVTFLKKDGTERTMICTLRQDTIPEVRGTGVKKTDDVISVFDLGKSEWRSFRVDSVVSIAA